MSKQTQSDLATRLPLAAALYGLVSPRSPPYHTCAPCECDVEPNVVCAGYGPDSAETRERVVEHVACRHFLFARADDVTVRQARRATRLAAKTSGRKRKAKERARSERRTARQRIGEVAMNFD